MKLTELFTSPKYSIKSSIYNAIQSYDKDSNISN